MYEKDEKFSPLDFSHSNFVLSPPLSLLPINFFRWETGLNQSYVMQRVIFHRRFSRVHQAVIDLWREETLGGKGLRLFDKRPPFFAALPSPMFLAFRRVRGIDLPSARAEALGPPVDFASVFSIRRETGENEALMLAGLRKSCQLA